MTGMSDRIVIHIDGELPDGGMSPEACKSVTRRLKADGIKATHYEFVRRSDRCATCPCGGTR